MGSLEGGLVADEAGEGLLVGREGLDGKGAADVLVDAFWKVVA